MPPLARPASTSESFLSPSSSSRRPPELPPLQAAARPRPAATRSRSVAVPPHSATARRARSRAPRFSLFLPHKRPPRSFPIPLTAYSNAVMHPHLTPLSPRLCACDSDASIGRAWIPPLRRWKSAALPQALAASPHPQAPVVANLRSPATRRARPRSRPRCRDRCAPFVVAGGTCSGESGLMAGLERRGSEREGKNDADFGYVSVFLRTDIAFRSLYPHDPTPTRPLIPTLTPLTSTRPVRAILCTSARKPWTPTSRVCELRLRSPRSAHRIRAITCAVLHTRRCVEYVAPSGHASPSTTVSPPSRIRGARRAVAVECPHLRDEACEVANTRRRSNLFAGRRRRDACCSVDSGHDSAGSPSLASPTSRCTSHRLSSHLAYVQNPTSEARWAQAQLT
ncbi:hypothetical protein B0H10DRAFT_1325687 [Mycena sp. CBHHK59/15]|nr:hypothetical protein B0H10DRAFT_1325687 [Mycena sp. CBHHK59/15]